MLSGSLCGRPGQPAAGRRRSLRQIAESRGNVARRVERRSRPEAGMLEQALEWIAQHRAAMVALVAVLALTLLAGRRW